MKIFSKIKNFLKDPLFLRKWEAPCSYNIQWNGLALRVIGNGGDRKDNYSPDYIVFVQDMYTNLMPYQDKGEHSIEILPKAESKEKLIASGISGGTYSMSLYDSVSEFIRTTAQSLFQNGVVFYEIVYKVNTSNEIEDFGLVFLESRYLFKFLSNYYQIIPWWVARRSRIRAGIVKIPCSKILRVDMPKQLGGAKKLKKILKRLVKMGKEIYPQFNFKALEKNENIGFDFNEYLRFKFLEKVQLTKLFGWNQREKDDFLTEYHFMTNYIRHKRAQLLVRNTIIDSVSY